MAATDGPSIIKLGVEDAIAGLALSTEAHWNQTEEDWRVFLHDGVVFGIRDGGRLVATAALLPYSGNNAWISMVLVTATPPPPWPCNAPRRCLPGNSAKERPDELARCHARRRRRLRAARIHADAAIAPAEAGEVRRRWPTQPPASATLDALRARDRRATGLDRTALLSAFAQRAGSRIVSANGAIALVRDGRTARHIGPVFADHAAAALTLVHAIAQSRGADRCCSMPSRRKPRSWKD